MGQIIQVLIAYDKDLGLILIAMRRHGRILTRREI